jgi:phosphate/sulfate permease
MINKIIGSIIIFFAIASFCYSVILFINQKEIEIALTLFTSSFFGVLIGMIVFRHGIRGVFKAYHDGTPPGLR